MIDTNVNISFTIAAPFLNHEEITAKLGIEPNYVRKRNEILSNGKILGHDEWGMELPYEEILDVSVVIQKMQVLLYNKERHILEILKTFQAEAAFLIVINMKHDDLPAIYINSDFSKLAGTLGADIGVDLNYFD